MYKNKRKMRMKATYRTSKKMPQAATSTKVDLSQRAYITVKIKQDVPTVFSNVKVNLHNAPVERIMNRSVVSVLKDALTTRKAAMLKERIGQD